MESHFHASEILLFAGTGILIMVGLALVMVSYANRAQRRMLTQRMQAQAAELRHQQELVQRNLATQEEERKRIAAHLHDDIGSKLGVLHLTFHRLRRAELHTPQYNAMCDEIDGLIANTLDTARRISHELLPPTLEDFGLATALEELCEQVRKTGALSVTFESRLERADISDPSTELNLFRIAQELLSNTLKYAQATEVNIELTHEGGQKKLTYRDNGRGFDPSALERKGLGMKNLESRAKIIGGHFFLKTGVGQGFEAEVAF
jgi:signal transduction histidine kinase